ncbi:MAG: preprotein translocase subunit SecE [Enterobacteriaceae bacterium PSpyr]|nr:MAG: preprotein translocase subunit SecE [Enterobacteriaceae bacterium PSpyr]
MKNINIINKINLILNKKKNTILLIILFLNILFLNKFNSIKNTLLNLIIIYINFIIIIKKINKKKISILLNEIYFEINKIFWVSYIETFKNTFIITIIIILFSLILYFFDNIIFYLINSIINM